MDLLGVVIFAYCLSEEEAFDGQDEDMLCSALNAVVPSLPLRAGDAWLAPMLHAGRESPFLGPRGTFFDLLHKLSAARIHAGLSRPTLLDLTTKGGKAREPFVVRLCRELTEGGTDAALEGVTYHPVSMRNQVHHQLLPIWDHFP